MHLAAARLKIIACICLYTMCSRLPAWYPSSHVLTMCLDCFLQVGQLCRCHCVSLDDELKCEKMTVQQITGGGEDREYGSCWAMWTPCWAMLIEAMLGPSWGHVGRCGGYVGPAWAQDALTTCWPAEIVLGMISRLPSIAISSLTSAPRPHP